MTLTVEQALEEGQIYCAFQPLVDLQRRTTFGFEALVRSESPDFPNAMSIIEQAVEHCFMGRLGRALRHMAVTHCSHHPLFLNLHPAEFDEGWLVRPDDAIASHDHDIYLEITESVPLTHFRYCHSVLREIRSKGIKVAVDDLGAGHSNLKYIADLAPEVVKLDRNLIAQLRHESRLQTLVTSIVELCNRLGARTVAEGIETREEMLAVLETGCHFGQGFFLGRPARDPVPVVWTELGL
ncbi:MAG TPA: EAL domain-containing protein [Candidatus Acidoferrum sp.]|nr:EAL domain-containing protein [Candidatus Acidoferrum sp.]